MLSRLLAHADAFRWQPGVTPLSSIFVVLAAPPLYVGGVFALRAGLSALRGPRPLPLGPLPAVHNAVLLLWSATMFAGCAQAAAAHTAAVGSPAWLLCTPPGTAPAGRLFFWSYVYYVSKARTTSCGRRGPSSRQAGVDRGSPFPPHSFRHARPLTCSVSPPVLRAA